jgi:hypothetical protein
MKAVPSFFAMREKLLKKMLHLGGGGDVDEDEDEDEE